MKKLTALVILSLIISIVFCSCRNTKVSTEVEETTTAITTETTHEKETLTTESELWEITWDDDINNVLVGPNVTILLETYNFKIVTYNESCCILFDFLDRSFWKASTNETFYKISGDQKVLDYNVAYDTLYWFNLSSEVWEMDWSSESEASLYCEDAIAVSPFDDENEGAIVSPERANWDGYGGLPIYSPYGD